MNGVIGKGNGYAVRNVCAIRERDAGGGLDLMGKIILLDDRTLELMI